MIKRTMILLLMLASSAWAAVPTQPAYTTHVDSENTTSHTINKPSSVQNGDVLVCFLGMDYSDGGVSEPSGWTAIYEVSTTGGADLMSGIYYHVVTDATTEPSTYTWTGLGSHRAGMQMICLRGVDTGTPLDCTISHIEEYDWDAEPCLSITTATNDALVFTFLCLTGIPSGPQAPADTTITSAGMLTTTYVSVASYFTQATAGATGDKTWDFTSHTTTMEYHAYQVAFRPTSTPAKATTPVPSDTATEITLAKILSWTDGARAVQRDIYFGTDSTPDNDGGSSELVAENSFVFTYDPTLAYSTTYYWRIDEKNVAGTATGDVWSFTTMDEPPNTTVQAFNPGFNIGFNPGF